MVLTEDGKLSLNQLPFLAGEKVEVLVVPTFPKPNGAASHPLIGTVLHYDQPTEPVAVDDWEAAS